MFGVNFYCFMYYFKVKVIEYYDVGTGVDCFF